MHRDVDVIAVPRVDIHGMEASTGAIDDLEPLSLLYCEVDQQGAVREVSEGLRRRDGLRCTQVQEPDLGTVLGGGGGRRSKEDSGITLKAMNLW